MACQYNQVAITQDILETAKEKKMLNSLLDIFDNFGWKAIHKSAQVGNVELVRLFIEQHQVDPHQLIWDGRSPLDLAKGVNAREVITYLNSLIIPLPEGANKA